jgi:hypothetical protein
MGNLRSFQRGLYGGQHKMPERREKRLGLLRYMVKKLGLTMEQAVVVSGVGRTLRKAAP